MILYVTTYIKYNIADSSREKLYYYECMRHRTFNALNDLLICVSHSLITMIFIKTHFDCA